MRVVSVAGYRDSGKTTLIERLIPVLSRDGGVATVKSIHHDVEVDTPGKDTHRHRSAGADLVVGVTPSTTYSISTAGKNDGIDLDTVLADLPEDEYAYVIVEGFKRSKLPSILIGDIEPEDVGGTVLTRVESPDSVDLEGLREKIQALDDGAV